MLTFNPDGSITIANDKRYLLALRKDLNYHILYITRNHEHRNPVIADFYNDINWTYQPIYRWNLENPDYPVSKKTLYYITQNKPYTIEYFLRRIFLFGTLSKKETALRTTELKTHLDHLYNADKKLKPRFKKEHERELKKANLKLGKKLEKRTKKLELLEIYKQEYKEINTLIKLCHDNS
jgi:hypothetical protein